ncbi:hypothetical protein LWI29_016780 [Acer saccharum]|uniref:NAC domain-containing protein n=1 Tax=Acer saccharum TaxID=4024 RepID=A0AA39S3G6_ACESA|nr:hypothetical protein LWI29_016780 [Acer saccharum]
MGWTFVGSNSGYQFSISPTKLGSSCRRDAASHQKQPPSPFVAAAPFVATVYSSKIQQKGRFRYVGRRRLQRHNHVWELHCWSQEAFRYENKKSPDNGAWIMHEFVVDPSLLRQHQKPDDIVLCRMKKNLIVEKKKRKKKLQQALNSEPWMSSKHSKLVEPQLIPILVQQYQ